VGSENYWKSQKVKKAKQRTYPAWQAGQAITCRTLSNLEKRQDLPRNEPFLWAQESCSQVSFTSCNGFRN